MNITILSGATSKCGEQWGVSPRTLVGDVVKTTLADAQIASSSIDALFIGNMLSSSLGSQDHLGAFFADELGLSVSAVKVEGACASGGLALHAAVLGLLSGMYKTVLVVGVEKMTDHKPEEVARALMGAGSDEEREAGATFPGLYALLARIHMNTYGTTEEDMAAVSVKNHFHASLTSHAQFPFPVTIAQVLSSPPIATPLKLLDCSPIGDGAAAVLLTTKPKRHGVVIAASTVSTDALGLHRRSVLTGLSATTRAAQKAFSLSGIAPADIAVAEVHDCFSIAEILAMEDIGFFKKGKVAASIREGITTLGGSGPIVNTSGGLKAGGHPIGATGVKQVVELFVQLSGKAGKRQVKDARVALAHNVGGSGATAVIHILKKY